jgi:hypothetical protein
MELASRRAARLAYSSYTRSNSATVRNSDQPPPLYFPTPHTELAECGGVGKRARSGVAADQDLKWKTLPARLPTLGRGAGIPKPVADIRLTAVERILKRGNLCCREDLAVSQRTVNTQPRSQRYDTQLQELPGRRN